MKKLIIVLLGIFAIFTSAVVAFYRSDSKSDLEVSYKLSQQEQATPTSSPNDIEKLNKTETDRDSASAEEIMASIAPEQSTEPLVVSTPSTSVSKSRIEREDNEREDERENEDED